jgi:hypothetical protein
LGFRPKGLPKSGKSLVAFDRHSRDNQAVLARTPDAKFS